MNPLIEFLFTNGIDFQVMTPGEIRAGDILMFQYSGHQRWGIAIKSARGVTFPNSQNTVVTNVIELDYISKVVLKTIVDSLFQNRIRAQYPSALRILAAIFGKNVFKTFIRSRMSGLKTVIFDRKQLAAMPDEGEGNE